MSRNRTNPRAGFSSGKRLKACRQCGGELPAGRRSFCSDECVHEWKIKSQPAYAAKLVFERDDGVCCLCEVDCVALQQELRRLRAAERRARNGWIGDSTFNIPTMDHELREGQFAERVRELGLKGARADLTQRLWEVDHAVPVVEGGGECGLDNLRTLCWRCHRQETAKLAKRRAKARRASHA